MLNHVLQSTIFAAAAALLTLALRNNGARTRHRIWLIVSLKFLVPFSLLTDLGSWLAPARVQVQVGQRHALPDLWQGMALPHVPTAPTAAVHPTNWFFAIWICGSAFVLARWLVRWRRIRASVRAGTATEPAVFGIFQPELVLPAGLAERLEPEQLEALIVHEMCHVRHRDNLAAALHMLVEAAFWFHPLVWWVGARLVEERERACDEEVLRLGNRREPYAESILKACAFALESPLPCVSGVTGGDLKRRIERIMTGRIARPLDRARKVLLSAAGIVAFCTPIAIGFLHPSSARGQAKGLPYDAGTTGFEVVSIKPSDPASRGISFYARPGGTLIAKNFSLRRLIDLAYNLKAFQLTGGPAWLDSAKFDIEAQAQDPKATHAQLRAMLQPVLAERFKLAFHRDSKEMPVYALVVAKGGPKLLPPEKPDGPSGIDFRNGATQFIGRNATTPQLAEALSERLQRMVIDKTAIAGNHDFRLAFTPDQALAQSGDDNIQVDPEGASIFAAIQEQLGLKLDGGKGPVEIMVIERAEKPSEN